MPLSRLLLDRYPAYDEFICVSNSRLDLLETAGKL